MKYPAFLPILSALTLPLLSSAQSTHERNADMAVTHDHVTGTNTVSWFGKQDHAYFLLTSDDLLNWSYINQIFVGADATEDSFNFSLSGGGDKAFVRINYSDDQVNDPYNGDLDGDGISNQAELDNGTDPFLSLDLDSNGIPDDADTLWATVPPTWIDAITANPNPEYYGVQPGLVLPTDDYDGDGLTNLQEYLTGSSATDYFNGSGSAKLRVTVAEGENVAPFTFLDPTITVVVENAAGRRLINAPVRFSTVSGHAGLAETDVQSGTLHSSVTVRANYSGAQVAFFAPSTLGPQKITASLPTGASLTITIHVVSPASVAKLPTRNSTMTEHANGDITYTWTSDADNTDWFQIEDEMPNGTRQVIFSTTYGSTELPYVPGENNYTLTLDKDNQPILP